jgi:anti-sigma regulatory factor (Ser/Thr protein kinase)
VLAEANQTARQPVLRQWRVFPGEASQLSVLRRWLTSFLPDCGSRDDLVSVATELASNAIRHTRSGQGGQFAVGITWYQDRMRVAVTDGGAQAGPKLITDPEGEHGRGLLLVRALATRTGVNGDQRSRLVWADVPFERAIPISLWLN